MAKVISDEARAKHHQFVRQESPAATRASPSGRPTSTSSVTRGGGGGRRRTGRTRTSRAASASPS
jgi:hypothetical protein